MPGAQFITSVENDISHYVPKEALEELTYFRLGLVYECPGRQIINCVYT